MERKASAEWKGGLKDGQGTISSGSGALSATRYNFSGRFEQGSGTNPEELIAAAHAACFSMALSGALGSAGMNPESIQTTATATLERIHDQWTVSKIHLETTVRAPGAQKDAFEAAAQGAKEGCPISRLLKPGTEITLTARLA
jgi:osmotically inducible protein OsmC